MYQAVCRERLRLRCWDGECVVYNDVSGDTHLLGGVHACLLQALLARHRVSRDDLVRACATGDEPPHASEALDEALNRLIQLRLCAAVDP